MEGGGRETVNTTRCISVDMPEVTTQDGVLRYLCRCNDYQFVQNPLVEVAYVGDNSILHFLENCSACSAQMGFYVLCDFTHTMKDGVVVVGERYMLSDPIPDIYAEVYPDDVQFRVMVEL